jgi:hypothetical protein
MISDQEVTMPEPNHVRQFQDTDPLAVSGYVAQAAKRALTSRAPPDTYLAADLYQILITPRSGESYQPETPWPVMCSRRQTLDHLMDQVFADCSARVIFRPAQGAPQDVSEDFARHYVRSMREGGADVEAILRIKFVGRHLTNDEVDEICGDDR